ncbi:ChbG/HpnK family deacetylase [Kitasatospora aureofaciens]|uniref:ChbG/HpnK family deacetylase n=1 Tax=Kitasatospora aureofaciens TaxID=1894 RepID=UPI0033AB86B6
MPAAAPTPEGPRANHLLGHPPDARLLLLNCDDLGLDESVNLAVIESVQQGIAASCSLMTPCHAAPHALRLLRRHPEIPFGIHLTLSSASPPRPAACSPNTASPCSATVRCRKPGEPPEAGSRRAPRTRRLCHDEEKA